tara:strand:+ start:3002 stop:3139 length:138 start_codon:yes stop_codon:yes gene_type:complete
VITEDITKKINSLLIALKEKTCVSNDELDEFKKILDLAEFSENHD